jgi:hypothetical protein
MDRNEAKIQMRLELERDIDPVRRTTAVVMTHEGQGYTSEQLMQEVEKDSQFGNQLLDSWISFQEHGNLDVVDDELDALDDFKQHRIGELHEGELDQECTHHSHVREDIMDQQTRDRVLALMQKDLDTAAKLAPTWADTPSIEDDDGNVLTPKECFQQVKDGTEFGNLFAEEFLMNYAMQEALAQMLNVPMTSFDGVPLDGEEPDKTSN